MLAGTRLAEQRHWVSLAVLFLDGQYESEIPVSVVGMDGNKTRRRVARRYSERG